MTIDKIREEMSEWTDKNAASMHQGQYVNRLAGYVRYLLKIMDLTNERLPVKGEEDERG